MKSDFEELNQEVWSEKGKVHMSCGNISKFLDEIVESRNHFYAAIENFEQCNKPMQEKVFENYIQGEFCEQPKQVTIA